METGYLTLDQAHQFVQECEENGTFIYGIERFLCKDGMNIPDLDGIADFSSLPLHQVSKSISASKDFLALFGDSSQERFKVVY
ncbi:hypothetical protein [Chelativorans alearense]|uniref:hypothetical protein n=1 Tax=Chelativorans alearense TaxID=2681495 RepID=UPI0013D89F33|nr:hypothetical protein [Chelativorans alearense]